MSKKRVLVVDDEPAIGEVVKEYLEGLGVFEVRVETKGASAYQAAKSFKPGMIVLDEMMPDVCGSEVFNLLSRDALTRNIPVVFLTGILSQDEVDEQDGEIGGRKFLAKPIKLNELATFIEQNIQKPK